MPDRIRVGKTSDTLRLAALLALVGGFLDGFTFVGHGGVFANAQTGNVVLVGVFAARGDWADAARHIPPLLAFVLGVATVETMRHPRVEPLVRWPYRVALVAEIVVLAVVGALPHWFSSTAIVLLIAYVAAVQNSTFGTVRSWTVNTTMTTGNMRTAVRAAHRAVFLHGGDRADQAEQARSFGAICLAFLVGAGLGALVTAHWDNKAAWVVDILLLTGLLMFMIDERRAARQ
jgi:uncharacterized membrane protein YoaK (UPF0700 family)